MKLMLRLMSGVLRNHIWAFAAGGLFAWGLVKSGMTQPEKIRGFLDFFGNWDPTMLFVLGVAVGVYFVAAFFAKRSNGRPWGEKFVWLEEEKFTPRFFLGAAMFGIGWGLVGLCPGPALVSIGGLSRDALLFFAVMMVGIFGADMLLKRFD